MKLNICQSQTQADPYVIKEGDSYYMYVTGRDGVGLYVSKDFSNWDYLGICYKRSGEKDFWAPSVIKIDDTFYMYVSSMPRDKDDVHEQRIQVASSKSPEGPYHYLNELLPPFSIDPHVVESGNMLFMFYSINNYNEGRVGTYIVVDLMDSPVKMHGKPVTVIKPTLDEEIFMRDRFKKGQHWHTLEGPFYFKEGDYHYLLYSGNCYEHENYFIGYAVGKGKEDDLRKIKFQKYPDENTYHPLLRKNEVEEGTGHNSCLKVNDKMYVIYHGRDINEKKNNQRTARICELQINKEKLMVVNR